MDLQIFNYEQSQIRTSTSKNGETLFVAKDICEALEIANSRDAVSRLDETEKDEVGITDSIGRVQQTQMVTESGLYALVFISRKEKAKDFRKWITTEVIPSIRKTGGYVHKRNPQQDVYETYSIMKKFGADFGLEGNQLLLSANMATKKLTGFDAMETLGVTHLLAAKQERHLTPTQLGKELGLSPQKVNSKLSELGFQEKLGDLWVATEMGKPYAVILDAGKQHSNGTPITQLKWLEGILTELKKEI